MLKVKPSQARTRTGQQTIKLGRTSWAVDWLKGFGKGLGSASSEGGYAWYAGI
jgi:hypothetical protein